MEDTTIVRKGNELNYKRLQAFLNDNIDGFTTIKEIRQFSGGYSNLTYLISTENCDYVLRKPPPHVNIKSAHDMGREYKILSALSKMDVKVPHPIFYTSDVSVLGSPFYVMEKVEGKVLRTETMEMINPSPENFTGLSKSSIDHLVDLHSIDIYETGLIALGKPDGYVNRQVEGWIKRYYQAKTDEISAMEDMAKWMSDHIPEANTPALIHNDYKYDNFILDQNDTSKIVAIVDWEMATVGDPLMDLGTTLAYWIETGDEDVMKTFNTTWHTGNMTRQEIIQYYGALTRRDMKEMPFYCVYGLYKVAVICQQIYARHVKGMTNDPRFGGLIHVVKAAAKRGREVMQTGKI